MVAEIGYWLQLITNGNSYLPFRIPSRISICAPPSGKIGMTSLPVRKQSPISLKRLRHWERTGDGAIEQLGLSRNGACRNGECRNGDLYPLRSMLHHLHRTQYAYWNHEPTFCYIGIWKLKKTCLSSTWSLGCVELLTLPISNCSVQHSFSLLLSLSRHGSLGTCTDAPPFTSLH